MVKSATNGTVHAAALDVFAQITAQLESARDFIGVFGKMPVGEKELQRAFLRRRFAYLAKMVHPDHAPVDRQTVAATAFRLLSDLRRAAEEAIDSGVYDQPFTAGKFAGFASKNANVILQSPVGI